MLGSWIAPHNFEGFFLNMGDMLVKAGDWQTAQKIYANAKLSREYGSWKFQGILEERIKKAQNNVAIFNASNETSKPRIMIDRNFRAWGVISNDFIPQPSRLDQNPLCS